MTTTTEPQANSTTALSRIDTLTDVAQRTGFARSDVGLICNTVAKGATSIELLFFLTNARRLGLEPLARQIYFVKRKKDEPGTIQTGIDGYRLLAERSGKYIGSDEPAFEYEPDGRYPSKASVTVWKAVPGASGGRGAFTASARWAEYYPGDGPQGFMWRKMPHVMLGKCFDEQTEVLTDRGFQRFANVTGHVLQVTEHGLDPTDARPFAQDWSGDMVTLDSDDLNFCVTPNHDMLTTDGKIEAADLFDQARARPHHWIPRCVNGSKGDFSLDDDHIQLAAAYLADGTDTEGGFRIEVSREKKVTALREIGFYREAKVRLTAGDQSQTAVRVITTRSNKVQFTYKFDEVGWLCQPGKRIKTDQLMFWSKRQARTFVDALIAFDGHTAARTGVRRFYTSRPDHLAAFEIAAVIAGYSVSSPTIRRSDISTKPNYQVTISSRSEIPVVRWGRTYQGDKRAKHQHTGLVLRPNAAGRVWCVTVPSGLIVVRRHGFSMVCGNCAEAQALRKAFPAELSGLYTHEEMDQAGGDPLVYDLVPEAAQPEVVQTAAGQVDTSTGEVLEETRPMAGSPSRQELWAINRQLVTECQRRGIAGGPTLNVQAGEDALILANQELRRRLDIYAQTHGDGPPPDDQPELVSAF